MVQRQPVDVPAGSLVRGVLEGLGRRRVEGAQGRGQWHLAGCGPQQLVGEGDSLPVGRPQAGGQDLLLGDDRALDAEDGKGPVQDVPLEPSPERRPGLEGLARWARHAVDAGHQQAPQVRRNREVRRGLSAVRGLEQALTRQVRHELFREEGVALGAPEQPAAEPGRRQPPEQGPRELLHVVQVERPDGDHELRVAVHGVGQLVELVARRDDGDRGVGERARAPGRAGPGRSSPAIGRRRGPGRVVRCSPWP